MCALVGVLVGYILALYLQPSLLPPALRIGFLREPKTVLFMGTDVVYAGQGRRMKADHSAFTGRSDTMMVAHLNPYQNTFSVLSVPRDTVVRIPGHGRQKINAANALGGPALACETVSQLLHMPVDHYVILNVRGLVELVDEIGGITITIPKRMKYRDNSAKLDIDLNPGTTTLSGKEAMGFVRFRHDSLGDIGRVQRQELFIRAILDKAMQPQTWAHLPKMIQIAGDFIQTDLSPTDITTLAAFVRAVPKSNQLLVMLPGEFSGTGDWQTNQKEVRRMVAKISGATFVETDRRTMRVIVCNASSDKGLSKQLVKILREKGYRLARAKFDRDRSQEALATSKIIAQRGNPEDAALVRDDLGGVGEIVNASVGDIESSVTVIAGDDLSVPAARKK